MRRPGPSESRLGGAKAGQMIKCSRDVAVMVFLWKNRTEAVGRLLRVLFYKHRTDHKGAAYLFELNHHESLVAAAQVLCDHPPTVSLVSVV